MPSGGDLRDRCAWGLCSERRETTKNRGRQAGRQGGVAVGAAVGKKGSSCIKAVRRPHTKKVLGSQQAEGREGAATVKEAAGGGEACRSLPSSSMGHLSVDEAIDMSRWWSLLPPVWCWLMMLIIASLAPHPAGRVIMWRLASSLARGRVPGGGWGAAPAPACSATPAAAAITATTPGGGGGGGGPSQPTLPACLPARLFAPDPRHTHSLPLLRARGEGGGSLPPLPGLLPPSP